MNKRFLFNWTIWISLVAAIYTYLYAISPLEKYGVVFATFVALPIYFISGAKLEEYPNFTISYITGVLWGMVFLWCITALINFGINVALSQAIVIFVVSTACIGFHFIVTANTLFNKLPAMFGGIAVTFSQGGKNIVPIMITLVLGTTLALICTAGTRFLTKDGYWKFFIKDKNQNENI